jgi:plasmid stabilization system protein ParE
MWTPEAKIDRRNIREYMTEHAFVPRAAYNTIKAIQKAVADIAFMPYLWPQVYGLDNNLIPPGYRKCLVKSHMIVYIVYEETELATSENNNLIGIIRIFHGRQNWLSHLAAPK